MVQLFLLEVAGLRIAWKKFKGGVEVEYVGYWMDLARFRLGVSIKRRGWLEKTLNGYVQNGRIMVKTAEAHVGRFSFAFLALEHLRPFLALYYAWLSVLPRVACVELPKALRLVSSFLLKEVKTCSGLRVVPSMSRAPKIEKFRADAKAEGADVVVGGWEIPPSGNTKDARWYSVRLDRRTAPWAYQSGEPFRAIAALEMFATILCILLFIEPVVDDDTNNSEASIAFTGATENLGSSQAFAKSLSTKFPLSCLLCEASALLARRRATLTLEWLPRQQNLQADALTNGSFGEFSEKNRIQVDVAKLEFIVLDDLLEEGVKLYDLINEEKTLRRRRK